MFYLNSEEFLCFTCSNGFLAHRDQGGTIISHAIEKKSPGLKVTSRIEGSSGGRRAFETSYGSMSVLDVSRFKGSNATLPNGVINHSEIPDNAAAKGSSSERRKPPLSEEQRLPQWGLGKRSRCKPTKPAAAPMMAQSAIKTHHLPPFAVQPSASASLRSMGFASNCHRATISPTRKEILAPSNGNGLCNGVHTRWARDGQAPDRAGDREGDRAYSLKVDNRLRARQQDLENAISSPVCRNQSSCHHRQPHHDHNGSAARIALPSEATTLLVVNKPPQLQPAQQRADPDILEWVQINLTVSRKEKEEDFFAIKGCKLPQRPKKRLKAIERTVHYITPGNLLIDMARGRYDVREKKLTKKKPGGLKAMESLESVSD